MASRPRSSRTTSRSGTAAARGVPFARKLALYRHLLSLFGHDRFEDLAERLKLAAEGVTEDNVSRLHYAVVGALGSGAQLDAATLLAFDANIIRHTVAIRGRRDQPIVWKYFQYLALLFTEIYLSRYFSDRERWLSNLNEHLTAFNRDLPEAERLSLWTADDLRKLAFWNATGSGKTLLMHVNILQYRHYLEKAGRGRELNRVVLLTPNEGLSRQHLEEFNRSRLPAELFVKDGGRQHAGGVIEIIDINKLREDGGDKTVAVDAFEGRNLVLVDEGHRGAGGDLWREMRRRLAAEGFVFEYSATFGQAVKGAPTPGRQKELTDEYAKAILFDYSYRFFYGDGYGKDYNILNFADDRESDEDARRLYLTACLLTFHQQAQVFADRRVDLRRFRLEKPLWVFVGGSVKAVRTESRNKVSDVVDILLFLAGFVGDWTASVRLIDRLLGGAPGLLNQQGREIFANAFAHLVERMRTSEQIYDDILRLVFNADRPGALHIEELKGSDGEIALRLGQHEPFGVINVGDPGDLANLCRERRELVVEPKPFTGSLFRSINDDDSTINVLIGSRKFTEGWNSYRVSTMGLMNMGRGEGSEVIQLFGRGVRLNGLDGGLKRHTAPGMGLARDHTLAMMETLNVFGIRADYMRQFKEYLEAEGLGDEDQPIIVTLPVVLTLGQAKLKILRLPDGIDFKRHGPKPSLSLPPEGFLPRHRVVLNWYPRLQAEASRGAAVQDGDGTLANGVLRPEHVACLDLDALWFELQAFKAERAWFNLNIGREAVRDLLLAPSPWYTLYIPPARLAFDSFDRVREWQDIAASLLKLYVERLYGFCKRQYEAPHVELQDLKPSDDNFFESYQFQVDKTEGALIARLDQIRQAILRGDMKDIEFGNLSAVFFDRHLYQPLFYASGAIQVQPVPLNGGERDFVADLRRCHAGNPDFFEGKELYLLRNRSRGRGVGFFAEGGFYPDFILWLLSGERQTIAFVDPKGLLHARSLTDPKIQFHKTIKDIEKRLGDSRVTLHSFIMSTTPFDGIQWWDGDLTQDDFQQHNVFFRTPDPVDYVLSMLAKLEA